MRKIFSFILFMVSVSTLAGTPLRRLPWLRQGDTIAILSPGGSVRQDVVDGGVRTLRRWGFVPVVAPNATKDWHGYGGTIAERTADLLWALRNPRIKAIMPTRGGDGRSHVLRNLPLDTLRCYPKWLIGFSDITALLSAEACAGWQSVHGSMCEAIARYEGTDTVSRAVFGMLTGQLPHYIINPHIYNKVGSAKGILIGGNMSVYGGLAGSEYDFLHLIEQQDCILFFEDTGESMTKVDRMFHMLELRGLLNKVKGIICGKFTRYTQPDSGFEDMYEMLHEYLQHYEIPTCYDFPVGHAHLQNFPMLIGAEVEFSVTDSCTTLKFH